MHSRVKGINEIQATRADLEKKENQTALNTSERKNDEVGIRVSTLRSNEICALFRLNTTRHQSSKLLEVTPDIAFLLLLASHLLQKLLLSMKRIELCVHQPSALLQLRQFNRAGLVGIQKPRQLRVRQLDLCRQLLLLVAQASLFSIPPVNPALPIRF